MLHDADGVLTRLVTDEFHTSLSRIKSCALLVCSVLRRLPLEHCVRNGCEATSERIECGVTEPRALCTIHGIQDSWQWTERRPR